MSKCLLIGGAGFIGSCLVEKLVTTGRDNIVVVGRSAYPRFPLPRSAKYLRGDAGDPVFLEVALTGCDEVIDLAYSTVPKTSFEDPVLDVIENLPATVTLLKLACARSLRRVLLVSSGGTVYGNPTYLPIDESHTTNPVSPYGITKLAAEKYAMLFHQLAGLPVTVVRPSNPYGPHQYGNSGQGFVGALLFAALNRIPVRIFGTRGTVRDYIYIEDLSEGLIAALEFGQAGEIYNIGTGIGLDNQSVVEELNRILDPIHGDIQVIRESPRPFDVRANILDAAKLIRISGWKPRTDFRAGLSVTLEWAVKHALLSQQ